MCKAGFAGPDCDRCPPGSYCPGGRFAPGPVTCPFGLTSTANATSPTDCVCAPGYGTAATGGSQTCGVCPAGTYSLGFSMTACSGCGAGPGFTTTPGAKAASECFCAAGYGGINCLQCPAGFYRALAPDKSDCQGCPTGYISPAGSTSRGQCVCLPGYGGTDCTQCDTGLWSAGGADAVCSPCGPGKTTIVLKGASTQAQCVCQPGRGGPACESCPLGTYRYATLGLKVYQQEASAIMYAPQANGCNSIFGQFPTCSNCWHVAWYILFSPMCSRRSLGGTNAGCTSCPGLSETTNATGATGPQFCGKQPYLISHAKASNQSPRPPRHGPCVSLRPFTSSAVEGQGI